MSITWYEGILLKILMSPDSSRFDNVYPHDLKRMKCHSQTRPKLSRKTPRLNGKNETLSNQKNAASMAYTTYLYV